MTVQVPWSGTSFREPAEPLTDHTVPPLLLAYLMAAELADPSDGIGIPALLVTPVLNPAKFVSLLPLLILSVPVVDVKAETVAAELSKSATFPELMAMIETVPIPEST